MDELKGKAVIAQGGGPTAVINQSMVGAALECRKCGGEAVYVTSDVSDETQCRVLVEKAVDAFGRLDLLVNNAGLNVIARLEDYSNLDLFHHTMDVNFYGAVYCTYYALPHLIQSRGRIVVVSSLGGKVALPYNSPYISSKFALHGFSDSRYTACELDTDYFKQGPVRELANHVTCRDVAKGQIHPDSFDVFNGKVHITLCERVCAVTCSCYIGSLKVIL